MENEDLQGNEAEAVEAAVHSWVVDCIHNSPLSSVTVAYNHLTAVLPELKTRILAELAKGKEN